MTVAIFAAARAATAATPAATTDASPQPKPFQLSAQVNQRPQLSRSDVDAATVNKSAPVIQPPSQISYMGQPANSTFKGQAQQAAAAQPPDAQDAVDASRAALIEKNVDWGGWVSKLADRWYYLLRVYEDGLGAQFVTARPALFQFTCYDDGRIANVLLRQSSGNAIYDHLQMIALMQTAPLPSFPQGTKRHSITLIQGWESHIKQPGEQDYVPGSFGKNFPMEHVREWVKKN
jgi:hypothetical protein